jgi:hypothetical protein
VSFQPIEFTHFFSQELFMKATELAPISAEPEAPAQEGYYWVRLPKGGLVGTTVHPPGASVKLPEAAAIEAVKAGGATPHGAFATLALGHDVPKNKPSKPSDPGAPKEPNAQMVKGTCFVGNRSYGPTDGPFVYPGDLIMRLAEQDPIPGSLMETYVQRLGRNRPVFKSINPLTPAEARRLARLRRTPDEASPAEVASAIRVAELARV